MRDFIGGSPRMVILSNGSGAEASSPLKKASAEGQARHPIHTILFPRETGFFIIRRQPENAPTPPRHRWAHQHRQNLPAAHPIARQPIWRSAKRRRYHAPCGNRQHQHPRPTPNPTLRHPRFRRRRRRIRLARSPHHRPARRHRPPPPISRQPRRPKRLRARSQSAAPAYPQRHRVIRHRRARTHPPQI